MKIDFLHQNLGSFLGNRFTVAESKRANYARGEDVFDPVLSQGIAFPNSNDEVSKIVKFCNDNKTPIVPFGTGTSLEGHVLGNEKGITVALENMNKILSVNAEALLYAVTDKR